MDQRAAAEQRYISSSITLRALAQEMGLNSKTVSRWCKEGGWVKKREKINRRAMKKAATQAVNRKAKELIKLISASDALEDALLEAARAFAGAMAEEGSGALVTDGKFRAGNLMQIVNAVGRQTETRMLQSGILAAADAEKLRLMRRKQEMEEQAQAEGQGGGEIRVVLTQESEELAE